MNMAEDKDRIHIQAESTWLNPAIKTKKELIDWILVSLGYPLVTIELSEGRDAPLPEVLPSGIREAVRDKDRGRRTGRYRIPCGGGPRTRRGRTSCHRRCRQGGLDQPQSPELLRRRHREREGGGDGIHPQEDQTGCGHRPRGCQAHPRERM